MCSGLSNENKALGYRIDFFKKKHVYIYICVYTYMYLCVDVGHNAGT